MQVFSISRSVFKLKYSNIFTKISVGNTEILISFLKRYEHDNFSNSIIIRTISYTVCPGCSDSPEKNI